MVSTETTAYCPGLFAHTAQTLKVESEPLALSMYPPQPFALPLATIGNELLTFWNRLVESPKTPPPNALVPVGQFTWPKLCWPFGFDSDPLLTTTYPSRFGDAAKLGAFPRTTLAGPAGAMPGFNTRLLSVTTVPARAARASGPGFAALALKAPVLLVTSVPAEVV